MTEQKYELATIGGGCFWCVEACFSMLKGVIDVMPGFSGGHLDNPTYEQVCTETTGHAEVIQIKYDPNQIDYSKIMQVFLFLHNPTELNRQGNDVGTRYRSVVFYHNPEQLNLAKTILAKSEAAQEWQGKYVTQIVEFTKFWPAEAYHKDYFNNNPQNPYCSITVGAKVNKFKQSFAQDLKA